MKPLVNPSTSWCITRGQIYLGGCRQLRLAVAHYHRRVLRVQSLNIAIGGRTLVTDGAFEVHRGNRVALVGRNGAGKSTIIRFLTSTLATDVTAKGDVTVQGTVGYIPQDVDGRGLGIDSSVFTHILSARGIDQIDHDLSQSRKAMEADPSGENIELFTSLEMAFGDAGGYTAEADIGRLCDGVELDQDLLFEDLQSLSGGQRRRVELVRVLYGAADTLILDEPTNHLDVSAKRWLMKELAEYDGGILIISHDIKLLDQAITRVVDLRGAKLNSYPGTYSAYRKQVELDDEQRGKAAAAEEKEIKRLKTRADSMRGRTARLARTAKSLDARIARIEDNRTETAQKDAAARFRLPKPPHNNAVPIEVEHLSISYGDVKILSDIDIAIERGERIAVMGINGAGKSSLLRCIAGVQEPTSGSVKLGHLTTLGYFAQEHEQLDLEISGLDNIVNAGVRHLPDARRLLGAFGLSGEKATQVSAALSGGERARLSMAWMAAQEPNVMVLDEPTNNLDIPSVEALITLLAGWNGTLLYVSHDRRFVEGLKPDRVILLPDEEVRHWRPTDIKHVEDR